MRGAPPLAVLKRSDVSLAPWSVPAFDRAGLSRVVTVLRNLDLLSAYRRFIDGLVHQTAGIDAVERYRHRSFIETHLATGLVVLAALPIYLAFVGPMNLVQAVGLLCLVLSAPVAMLVAQTGRLDLGHLVVGGARAAMIAWVALMTGGLQSLAIVWLAVLPIEGALSGSRSVVRGLFGIGVAAALGVAALAPFAAAGPSMGPDSLLLTLTSIGIAYMALLAIRMEKTNRIASEEALRHEAHSQLLAENIGDIVSGHTQNGDVAFITPAIERVMALRPSEALGDGLFRCVHIADRPAYLKALSDALTRGIASSVEFRARHDHPDGASSYIWLEMRCRALSGDNPFVKGARVVAVTRDVTERKIQEAELLAAREQAEIASLSKTRFLANVSHELRTPLNAIIGFSDLLGTEVFGKLPDPRQREYVRLIHESGEHLLQVVNDILDMSKIETGAFDVTPEPFDLPQLIESTRQMMSHQAQERGLKIQTSLGLGLPELVADRRACRQILINLISNAIKFTDREGVVTVGTRREGGDVALFVRDTGIGISEKDIARLGTPFVQADSGYDRRHEGTGLGLSVVKGLAALHGGTMQIESRLGEGTCVTVRLPINGEAREQRKVVQLAAPERDEAPDARQKRA